MKDAKIGETGCRTATESGLALRSAETEEFGHFQQDHVGAIQPKMTKCVGAQICSDALQVRTLCANQLHLKIQSLNELKIGCA